MNRLPPRPYAHWRRCESRSAEVVAVPPKTTYKEYAWYAAHCLKNCAGDRRSGMSRRSARDGRRMAEIGEHSSPFFPTSANTNEINRVASVGGLRVLFTRLPPAFAIYYWRRFFASEMADYVFGRHDRAASVECANCVAPYWKRAVSRLLCSASFTMHRCLLIDEEMLPDAPPSPS